MYKPFEQAIDRYIEHPEHLKPLVEFVAFLEKCDVCEHRVEFVCPKCKCRHGKSCIRLAELPGKLCPLETV